MADNIQSFIKELAFEEALTNHLLGHGLNDVIMNPTEEQLVENWAHIIYDNNRGMWRHTGEISGDAILAKVDSILESYTN